MGEYLIQPTEGETFEQLYARYEQAIAKEPENRDLLKQYAEALIIPLIDGVLNAYGISYAEVQ